MAEGRAWSRRTGGSGKPARLAVPAHRPHSTKPAGRPGRRAAARHRRTRVASGCENRDHPRFANRPRPGVCPPIAHGAASPDAPFTPRTLQAPRVCAGGGSRAGRPRPAGRCGRAGCPIPTGGRTPTRPTASPSTRAASRTSTTSTPTRPRAARCSCSNPDRRTSFDKFNPFTIKGQSPAGLDDADVRDARACARGDEPRHDVRPARRGDAGRARQVVDHLPHPPEGALQQRRPGHRRGRRSTRSRR